MDQTGEDLVEVHTSDTHFLWLKKWVEEVGGIWDLKKDIQWRFWDFSWLNVKKLAMYIEYKILNSKDSRITASTSQLITNAYYWNTSW